MKLEELAELMGVTVKEAEEKLKQQDTIQLKLKDRERKQRESGKITVL